MNLLINPGTMVQSSYSPPPLGLLYVAGDTDTTIFDAAIVGDPIPFLRKHRPELVGVAMYTPGRHESSRILREAKALGARTVAGGPHVALMTKQLEETCPWIDHLVVGDGELAWKSLCAGTDLPRVIKMPVPDLDALPLPAWDKITWSSYSPRGWGVQRGVSLGAVPRISIVLGRGCNGSCSFCLPAGTLVLMASGEEREIQVLRPGELVRTVGSDVGTITHNLQRLADELIVLNLASGKRLELTPEHPVLTHNRGWVQAMDLLEGDNVVETL